MSVAYRSTCGPTLGRCVDRDVSVDISTYRPICRSTCRPTHLDRHIGRESVDMSTDISVEHRSMCQPTVDRYVGRDVDRHIGRGVRKLYMIRTFLPRAIQLLLHLGLLSITNWWIPLFNMKDLVLYMIIIVIIIYNNKGPNGPF